MTSSQSRVGAAFTFFGFVLAVPILTSILAFVALYFGLRPGRGLASSDAWLETGLALVFGFSSVGGGLAAGTAAVLERSLRSYRIIPIAAAAAIGSFTSSMLMNWLVQQWIDTGAVLFAATVAVAAMVSAAGVGALLRPR